MRMCIYVTCFLVQWLDATAENHRREGGQSPCPPPFYHCPPGGAGVAGAGAGGCLVW